MQSITLYEEVHPISKLSHPKVQSAFLDTLKSMVPDTCKPIIITDAGFYSKWFKKILSLDWDYVSRVRGSVLFRIPDKTAWKSIKTLFKPHSERTKIFNNFLLSKMSRLPCVAVLNRNYRKLRKRKTITGKNAKCSSLRKIAKGHREPWLLVTSLYEVGSTEVDANRVISIYSLRMQIEENFRDTKSINYGMGLKSHRSRSVKRIQVLLLIAAVAHYIAYVLGVAASHMGLAKTFQANTVKSRRVISFVYLGKAIWKTLKAPMVISIIDEKFLELRVLNAL